MTHSDLVLASGSPRRHVLLSDAQIKHCVIKPGVEERILEGETPRDFVVRTAFEKASHVSEKKTQMFVLAADTSVVFEEKILGKPLTAEKTRSMITQLSGKKHFVLSGVALVRKKPSFRRQAVVSSEVTFRTLTCEEIETYVESREGFDKAGGYGIQGKGGKLVEKVEGSWSNVVGLPMETVDKWLSEIDTLFDGKV